MDTATGGHWKDGNTTGDYNWNGEDFTTGDYNWNGKDFTTGDYNWNGEDFTTGDYNWNGEDFTTGGYKDECEGDKMNERGHGYDPSRWEDESGADDDGECMHPAEPLNIKVHEANDFFDEFKALKCPKD